MEPVHACRARQREVRLLPARRLSGIAALALLVAAALPGAAQTACETALRDAAQTYELGVFDQVPQQLAPCFQQRASRARLAEAYALLAKTFLAADEPAKARQAVSDLLRTDPAFEAGPPPRFAQLVARVRREESTVRVTSVSKSSESLREAPATVLVVTAAEIERRGYLDLEQLLHDLPGFDISRSGDTVYSSIFQRGFFGQGRNLLLLDGVEQNDLSSNAVQLSRQIALSGIDRVEVIYGPASTMYGANAYTGVINVITKEPEGLIAEDKRFGVAVQAATGGLQTRYADLTAAGRDIGGNVSWSVASRLYHADDTGLARFSQYRFDFSGVDYRSAVRPDDSRPVDCGSSPLLTCTPSGQLQLSDAGVALARQLDRELIQSQRFHFSNPADDWSVYAKLKISNLLLGLELWRTREGTPAVGSLFQNGQSTWAPRQLQAYLKYTQPVGRDLAFNAFFRYQQSGLDPSGTRIFGLNTYANGTKFIQDLLDPTTLQPSLSVTAFRNLSTQIRGELNLVYEPSPRFSAVGGIELWKSSIQSSVDQFDPATGDPRQGFSSPFQVEHTDLAAYAQVSYKLARTLRLLLAGRLNYNTLSTPPLTIFVPTLSVVSGHGYGTLFSPRAAVVYTPTSAIVLKAIYSEAFKDPTDDEKFGDSALAPALALVVPTAILTPERVRNFELSAGWQPNDALAVQASAYQASYTNLVSFQQFPATECFPFPLCGLYQNSADFRIRGLQVDGRYRLAGTEITGNYTFTSPASLHPLDAFGQPLLDDRGNPVRQQRIGDIASHHLNLGVNRDWLRRLNTDLRLRWVGARPIGRRTTDTANPLASVDAYTDVQATVSYRGLLPGTTLQLIMDNLFNRTYFDPGTRPALGVSLVPQPGRTVFLRIITGLDRPLKADPR